MIKNPFTALFSVSILTLRERRKTCREADCRDLGASEEQRNTGDPHTPKRLYH